MSGFSLLAGVCGSWIGSQLLSQHVYLLNGLSIACYVLTICVSTTIPSHCGRVEQDDESSALVMPDQEDPDYDNSSPSSAESAVHSNGFSPKVALIRALSAYLY